MTNMTAITKTIKQARRNGSSDADISRNLHIDQAEIKRLLSGKYPGESVAARLGLPVKCSRCHRRLPSATPRPRAPLPDYMKQWRALPAAKRNELIRQWMNAMEAYG